MVLGVPLVTFIAFIVQPIIFVLAVLYAINYEKLIKRPPFNFLVRLEEDFKDR